MLHELNQFLCQQGIHYNVGTGQFLLALLAILVLTLTSYHLTNGQASQAPRNKPKHYSDEKSYAFAGRKVKYGVKNG